MRLEYAYFYIVIGQTKNKNDRLVPIENYCKLHMALERIGSCDSINTNRIVRIDIMMKGRGARCCKVALIESIDTCCTPPLPRPRPRSNNADKGNSLNILHKFSQ